MKHLKLAAPVVLLLAAASAAAATQGSPQAAPSQTAPARGAATPQAAPAAQAPAGESSGERANRALHELRQTLWRDVLGQYPPSVGRSLQLSPMLLSDDTFLARYPQLEAFLKEHPDVRLNPDFFFPNPRRQARNEQESIGKAVSGVVESLIGMVVPVTLFGLMGFVVWLQHTRRLKIAAAQQEAQSRALDRLLAREDLAAYLDTPAGRRLLESTIRAAEEPASKPATRVIRSVGAGVVLLFLGGGLFAASRALQIDAEGRAAFGIVTAGLSAIGLGLLVSGGASYLLSKRFGLIQTPDARD
ncbi:MAG: hypothetical protein AB7K63_14240 [Vicinamibacterales bacterium]